MKVTGIDTFLVKSLGRPWMYCAVRTDEGITGYSGVRRGRSGEGLAGSCRRSFAPYHRQGPSKRRAALHEHGALITLSVWRCYLDGYRGHRAGALGCQRQRRWAFPFTSLLVVPRARSRRCTGPTLCPSSQRTTRPWAGSRSATTTTLRH